MKTIKARPVTIAIASVILVLACLYGFWISHSQEKYRVKTVRTETGWGYSIRVNDQIIIYQDYIPAQEGKSSFRTREAAKMAGELMVKKFNKNEMPGITKYELDSILSIDRKRIY